MSIFAIRVIRFRGKRREDVALNMSDCHQSEALLHSSPISASWVMVLPLS